MEPPVIWKSLGALICQCSGQPLTPQLQQSPQPFPPWGTWVCLINDQETGKAVVARRPGPAAPEAHRAPSQSGPTEADFAAPIVSQPCEGVPQRTRRAGPTWLAALGGF